jgi:hypothetical protein
MAQTIFHENNRDLIAFDENQRFLGMFEPGVYRGFDSASFVGTTLTLAHTLTGVEKTNLAANGKSNKTGIVLTNQGSLIHEDASVDVTVAYNGAGGDERIDLIVADHEYQDSPGGLDAGWVVIQGTVGAGAPALTDVNNQVIIGRVTVPAGAANHDNTIFTREAPAALGQGASKISSSIGNILFSLSSDFQTWDLNLSEVVKEITSFDGETTPGIYLKTSATVSTNAPVDMTGSVPTQQGILIVFGKTASNLIQLWIDGNNNAYWRVNHATTWSAWKTFQSNVDTAAINASIAANTSAIGLNTTQLATVKNDFTIASAQQEAIAPADFPSYYAGTESVNFCELQSPGRNTRVFNIQNNLGSNDELYIARIDVAGSGVAYQPGDEIIIIFNDANMGTPDVGIVQAHQSSIALTSIEDFETNHGQMNILLNDTDINTSLEFTGDTKMVKTELNSASKNRLIAILRYTGDEWIVTKIDTFNSLG